MYKGPYFAEFGNLAPAGALQRSTELYYVLEGEGTVSLDEVEHEVRKGSIVHIPPGVVHGAKGRMRVLVVGIPDIAEDDLFFPE